MQLSKQQAANLKNAKTLAQLITNKFKLKILEVISEKRECTVTEIIDETGWAQSLVSQHLAGLRKTGLVENRKTGKYVYYSINQYAQRQIASWAATATLILDGDQ